MKTLKLATIMIISSFTFYAYSAEQCADVFEVCDAVIKEDQKVIDKQNLEIALKDGIIKEQNKIIDAKSQQIKDIADIKDKEKVEVGFFSSLTTVLLMFILL